MANSFVCCNMHCVFSTKDRAPRISEDIRQRLWAYAGGIARENHMKALAVGGTVDHIHLLLTMPPTLTIAKAMQLIKGGSSKWVHDTFSEHRFFEWQEGYGAFSVSASGVEATIEYINNQEAHHRKQTFQEEFLAFLKKYGVAYDEQYVWG